MALGTGNDVREILELSTPDQNDFKTKDAIFNEGKKKKPKKMDMTFKKPEGMARELWGLLWTDNRDGPPILPTDTSQQGYKQMKAKIGQSRVRPWSWMPFTNPARKDAVVFHHWRRKADEGKDYPFARFNKHVDVPVYTHMEYQQHLHDESWTRPETDQLFDLCNKFDLRFVVMHDRWDVGRFSARSIEDMKERYYYICNVLTKVRAASSAEMKMRVFDADHERRRKEQLNKLFHRTQEQLEEEDTLMCELKKIEQRKKEREKKTQDLQKLITAADSNMEARRSDRKASRKRLQQQQLQQQHRGRDIIINPEATGIKFADCKQSGVSLRSQRMKLPASVGQKKTKAIEQILEELNLELNPMPTDDIVQNFNELRQDIVLLYELKLALANCEYELQTFRHRFDTLAPGRMPQVPVVTAAPPAIAWKEEVADVETIKQEVDDLDIGHLPTPDPAASPAASPAVHKKRRSALEQGNSMLKKFKQKLA